jgi:hypothetical protein
MRKQKMIGYAANASLALVLVRVIWSELAATVRVMWADTASAMQTLSAMESSWLILIPPVFLVLVLARIR